MITSTSNDRIKSVRKLHRKSHRQRTSSILLEGVRLIRDAISSGVEVAEILYSPELLGNECDVHTLIMQQRDSGTPCYEVSAQVFESFAKTVTPQGLAAVVAMPHIPVRGEGSLTLILDGVATPGNAGTLLRSAEGAGVEQVIFGPLSVDAYNNKVIRSAMGAHFRLPIVTCSTWEAVWDQLDTDISLYAADLGGALAYTDIDWRQPAAVIIGNEATGPSEDSLDRATSISIPMQGKVESLNAAMAGTIILFEVARQRSNTGL